MANRAKKGLRYWVFKNNAGDLIHYKVCIGYVLAEKLETGNFPSEQKFKENIIQYLRYSGISSAGKKTSAPHQLLNIDFWRMVQRADGLVKATSLGEKFFYSRNKSKVESALVYQLLNNLSFGESDKSIHSDFYGVRPFRELFANLMKYGHITSEQLNYCFYQTKSEIDDSGGVDLKLVAPKFNFNDRIEGPPQWKKSLFVLLQAGLIYLDGTQDNFIPPVHGKEHKSKYKASARMMPTDLLRELSKNGEAENLIDRWWDKPDGPEWSQQKSEQEILEDIQMRARGSTAANSGRTRQTDWRRSQIVRYEKCVMCSMEDAKILEAAHILPYKKCDTEREKYAMNNGLLMCRNHHKAYDANIFSLAADESGAIKATLVEEKISHEDLKLLSLNEESLARFNRNNMIDPRTGTFMEMRNSLKEYGATA